jgi:hypothetical protein
MKIVAKMHGVQSFKIAVAQQAKIINNCRNTKLKLLKTNTAIKVVIK